MQPGIKAPRRREWLKFLTALSTQNARISKQESEAVAAAAAAAACKCTQTEDGE